MCLQCSHGRQCPFLRNFLPGGTSWSPQTAHQIRQHLLQQDCLSASQIRSTRDANGCKNVTLKAKSICHLATKHARHSNEQICHNNCVTQVGLYHLCQINRSCSYCDCIFESSLTCGSLRPLESESEVSLYSELAISTSVDALLRFFSGLHESEISLAPTGLEQCQQGDIDL